jgi:hypothetical protein
MSAFERLGAVLDRAEGADPAAASLAREVASAVLDLHAEALGRVLAHLRDRPEVLSALAADEVIASVLSLHGLHPVPPAERVLRALDALGAELAKMAVAVAGVRVEDGRAEITLRGEGAGRPAARKLVEEALLAQAPELEETAILSEPALVPVERLFAGRAGA